MSTATKAKPTTSVTAELERLEAARAKAKAKVEGVRSEVEAFDAGIPTLERMRSENPHAAAHQRARAESKRCRRALDQFKIEHCADRISELQPGFDDAEQAIHAAGVALQHACEMYKANVAASKAIVDDTPWISRGREPGLGSDGRVAEWRRLADEIVAAEVVAPPGLTGLARWTLEKHSV